MRQYLEQILITNYEASWSLAFQTAGKWQLGRFSDLHETSLKDFENTFGTELGKLLFRSVQDDVAHEFHASPAGIFNFWGSILVITLAGFFSVRAYYSSSKDRKWDHSLRAIWVLGPPMFFLAFQGRHAMEDMSMARFMTGLLASSLGLSLYVISWIERMEQSQRQARRTGKNDKEG